LHVQSARAGQTAWRFVALFYGKSAWNSLGVLLVSRFFCRKAFLITIGQIYGANSSTLPAAGAFVDINITRIFPNTGFKVTLFAIQTQ
jgi:hypothetical protein